MKETNMVKTTVEDAEVRAAAAMRAAQKTTEAAEAAERAAAPSLTAAQQKARAARIAAERAAQDMREAHVALLQARADAALELKLGRKLREGEFARWVGGSKQNLRPENLELCSAAILEVERATGRHVREELDQAS